jgi:1-acyl-sn-glycerol-3-phosphate acyltransferase
VRRREIPFWYWLVCSTVRIFLRIWERLEVHNSENVPAVGGCVIASNHASYLDPPALAVSVKHRIVHFMARNTLFSKPLARWFLTSVQVLPVDRTKGDVGAIRRSVNLLKSGNVLGLFPEGTRSPSGEIQSAKGGIGFLIAKAEVPVVPAYVDGSFQAFPKGSKRIKRGQMRIFYGKPIEPAELAALGTDRDSYKRIGELVMKRIAELKPCVVK